MRNSKPNNFDERLQHSISLLQKAEKLAIKYDSENGFYLAFSGGKDSQALYHVAQMAGVKFQAHMNFTSVDPPQVIRFVRRQYPDVITHAPTKSIYQLAVEHQLLPSRNIRWCCSDFKEYAGAGKVCLIGIRASESARRAKRHEVEVSSKKFSGNIEQFFEWQTKELERREGILLRRMKREGKKINEDYFSMRNDNEVRCINGKDSILISPIFDWSEKDVWYFLNEVAKVPHCSLYDNGYKRIGCICCPMSTYKQRVLELKDFPHVKRNWIKAIKAIRRGGVYLNRHNYQRESEVGSRTPTVQCGELAQKGTYRYLGGFSDSPSASGDAEGQDEDAIAENIFDWWISGKSYERWYSEKFLQLRFDFDYEE